MDEEIGAGSRKVLVVEDEILVRDIAVCLLEELGYEVLEASSAEEAITMLEAHDDVKVVFSNVNMVGPMDGVELAAYAHRRWPPLQFIIVSGAQRPTRCELPDSARFFPKPYDMVTVARALKTMIDGATH